MTEQPHDDDLEPSYSLRSRNLDGTHNETDGLTAEQAAKLNNGQAVAWTVTDERIVVDDDGTITHRDTAG